MRSPRPGSSGRSDRERALERPRAAAARRSLDRGAVGERRRARPTPTASSRSAAARRSTPASTRRRRPGCRSSTSRRRTPGAEWTTFYGIRSPDRRMQGGGAGAHPVALVYDVDLTLDLPPAETAGTALNALAHCAEALYVRGRSAEGDEQALAGAPLIAVGAAARARRAARPRGATRAAARRRARGSCARARRARARARDGAGARRRATACRTAR